MVARYDRAMQREARLPPLVIVSGAPAVGKTTLAAQVAGALRLPLLTRDELKEAIADTLGTPRDVAQSQRFGNAAYALLFLFTARLLDAGRGAVIESNFRRGRSEDELRPLVARADARLIHCAADAGTLTERYALRHRRGERHPVHLDADRAGALAEDLAAGRFEPLDLPCPTLVVRTDDGYQPPMGEILAFSAP